MANEGVNTGRRRFLTATTAVVGGAGAIFAAVPFIKSWKPSARAQQAGAPVTVDVSRLLPGQRLTVTWRGQPVWLIRRTEEQVAALPSLDGRLRDPNSENPEQQPAYAANPTRSIRPELAVLIGICTHLGCVPLFRPEMQPQPFDAEWKGGFYCPCHNSRFDLAARVLKGAAAPTALEIPPRKYLSDARVVVGGGHKG